MSFFVKLYLILFIIKIGNSSFQTMEKLQNNILNIEREQNNQENVFKRKLDAYSDTLKICERSTNDLQKYFETGDIKYVKLYNYKGNEKVPYYIFNLIDYLLEKGDSKFNLRKYLKHIVLPFIFFIISLICIPGWVVFWICKCKKCSPLACCQKPNYRLPFFIIVSILNAGVILTSLLSLIYSNDLFRVIASTECSTLEFLNEISDGEHKNVLPRWGGFPTIIGIFDRTISQIEDMNEDNSVSYIEEKLNEYNETRKKFVQILKEACDKVNGEESYNYNNYILDIAKKFGKFENDDFSEGDYAFKWMESTRISNDLESSNILFSGIIFGETLILEFAKFIFEIMEEGINNWKKMIVEKLLDYSKKIDNIGKLVFKLTFGLLFSFSILMEALLIFLYLFSSRKCIGNFKLLNFSLKILIHIFWNIFSFFMIIIFLMSTAFFLGSNLGMDTFYAFSFIISSKNLNSDSPLVLGEAGSFFNVCFNEDGALHRELGLDLNLEQIEKLKNYVQNFDDFLQILNTIHLKDDKYVDTTYNELMHEISEKKDHHDFAFVPKNPLEFEQNLTLNNTIRNINPKLENCSINERWSEFCNEDFPFLYTDTCPSSINPDDQIRCYDPFSCGENELKDRYQDCNDAKNIAEIIDKFISAIKNIENSEIENSIINQANNVSEEYRDYLLETQSILSIYTAKFRPLTSMYDNLIGNHSLGEFINCSFFGTNIRIVLYFLDYLSNEFQRMGIVFFITGIEMALSISFTIILINIFNATIKIREDKNNIEGRNNSDGENFYKDKSINDAKNIDEDKKNKEDKNNSEEINIDENIKIHIKNKENIVEIHNETPYKRHNLLPPISKE